MQTHVKIREDTEEPLENAKRHYSTKLDPIGGVGEGVKWRALRCVCVICYKNSNCDHCSYCHLLSNSNKKPDGHCVSCSMERQAAEWWGGHHPGEGECDPHVLHT